MISHIRSYSPHHLHIHPSSLSVSSTTLPSLQNTEFSHPFLYLHVMIMSWHGVKHTPSTASTQHCLSSIHYHDHKLTPECSFSSGVPPYMIDRHQRAPHQSSKLMSPCHIPMIASKLTDELRRCTRLTIYRLPASTRPNSHDYVFEVHVQASTVMSSKFAWS